MNFDEAVSAHAQWKMKLSSYLLHPDASMDPAKASQVNQCALGQWILGEGAKHSMLPEYANLKSAHSRFHKAVGDVLRRAATGQNVGEDMALGSDSEFGAASSGVVSAIMAMKAKVQNAAGKGA